MRGDKPRILEFQSARQVLKTYDRKIFKIKNVNLTSIRFENGHWRLKVGVSKRLPEHDKLRNPNINIKGLPVDVEEIGEIKALAVDRTAKHRPAPPGVSIGHVDISAGTFGCTCFKSGTKYILSNNHVLANTNAGEIGDHILQPGVYDGGDDPNDKIGTLADFEPIVFGDPENPNLVDCAIALPDDEDDVSDELLELQYPRGHKAAEVGMEVAKSGRTSAVTMKPILEFSGLIEIGFGEAGVAYFDDQIITRQVMAEGGDSGSCLIDLLDNKAVGLLFAGSLGRAIFNRMTDVVDALGISIFDWQPEHAIGTTQFASTGYSGTELTLHGNVPYIYSDNPHRYFEWGTSPGVYTHTEDCGIGGVGQYNKVLNLPYGVYYYRAKIVDGVRSYYGVEVEIFHAPYFVGETSQRRTFRGQHQRRTFYTAGRYWIFYTDGWDGFYQSSTDGETWETPIIFRYEYMDGIDSSIWFDGTYVHCSYGDAWSDSNVLYYRRGKPETDGTVTWTTDWQTVPSISWAYITSICTDTDGYVWIGYTGFITGFPMVVKSGNNDGTWGTTPSGFPKKLNDTSDGSWVVALVPLTEGKILASYCGRTTGGYYLRVRVWNGSSWSDEVQTSGANQVYHLELIPPSLCLVAVGDDVHFVFTKHSPAGSIIYIKYTYSTSSFSAGEEIASSSETSPKYAVSLSKDSSNNLYCFWADDTNKIYRRKYAGSSWGSKTTVLTAYATFPYTPYTGLYEYGNITTSYEDYGGGVTLFYIVEPSVEPSIHCYIHCKLSGYERSATASLGLLGTAGRSIGLSRLGSSLVGLKGVLSKAISLIRSKLSYLGLVGTGTSLKHESEGWVETEWQNTLETDDTYYEDLSNLEPGTDYEYQTKAKNTVGEGEWSTSEDFTTLSVYERVGSALLGLLGTASRGIGLSRAKEALLGLKGLVTKTIDLVRTKIALLGLKGDLFPERYEYYNTGDNSSGYFFWTYWKAQTFTPSVTHKVGFVRLKLYRSGSPGTITVSIKATDEYGHPIGDDLCSGTINGNTLTTAIAGEWYEINLGGGYVLSTATKYAIVVRAQSTTSNNMGYWRHDTSYPTYSDGNYEKSNDSGDTWEAYYFDFMFEEWAGQETEREITINRAKALLLGLATIAIRTRGYQRVSSALLGLLTTGLKSLSITRTKEALLGLKGLYGKVVGRVRTDTGLLGLLATATKVRGYSRVDTALLGLKSTASKILSLTRSGVSLLGLKLTGIYDTIQHYTRNALVYLGLLATGTRATKYIRSKVSLLGLKGTGIRGLALARSYISLLGLKATGAYSTMEHYIRTGVAYLGLFLTGSRVIDIVRVALNSLLGLLTTGVRVLSYQRVKVALLGLKTTATRVLSLIRSKVSLLGLNPIATRVTSYFRTKTALLGLKGIATRSLGLVRSKVSLLGLKATGIAETIKICIRTGVAYLGLVTTSVKALAVGRSKLALLGLAGSGLRAINLLRSKVALLGLEVLDRFFTEEQTSFNSNGNLGFGGDIRSGQRLTISNRWVTALSFLIRRAGSPTGDVTFTIRRVSDDSIIASKVWGDASSLYTYYDWKTATFDNAVLVNEEVRILVEWGGGDGDNYLQIRIRNTDVKAGEGRTRYDSGWYDYSYDMTYKYDYLEPMRVLSLGRAKEALLGLSTTGIKAIIKHYFLTGVAYLGLLATGVRALLLGRTKTALFGLKTTATRIIMLSRSKTTLLGLLSTGLRILSFNRISTALLGLLSTAMKTLGLIRLDTTLLGLKSSATRMVTLTRSSLALLDLKATGIYEIIEHYIRAGIAYLGIVGSGMRTVALSRIATALLGLKGIATKVVTLIGHILRMFLFTKTYHDLKVFTKTYHDVKIWTGEDDMTNRRDWQKGETVPIWAEVKLASTGALYDPDQGVKVWLYDEDSTLVSVEAGWSMTKDSTGMYVYYWNTDTDDKSGWYRAKSKAQDGTGAEAKVTIENGTFLLQ